MDIAQWETPISAPWSRSLELESIRYKPGGIIIRVSEEHSQQRWSLSFAPVQGLRVTTNESAFEMRKTLDGKEGGMFVLRGSAWLTFLGAEDLQYMNKSRHFVISCYDEVVEVAAWDVSITHTGT